jgi:hypothetical protein
MDVNLHWFNGYYNKSFSNKETANKYFNNQIEKDIDKYQCHPLVNSKWCKIQFGTNSPLELEFARNAHEWNYLHPLFEPFWYQETYLTPNGNFDIDPYAHFLEIGHKEGNSVHPLIDTQLLMKQSLDRSYIDTITHFGEIMMLDQCRSLRSIRLGHLPIMNLEIDWNYLYPAMAWKWT